MTNIPMHLTARAIAHIQAFLDKQEASTFLGMRLGVKPSGCSGYRYLIEAVDAVGSQDKVFESGGVTLVVDQQSLKYLEGCEVDFSKEGLNSGFKFNNPNVQDTCGCGESFNFTSDTQKQEVSQSANN